MASAMPHAKAGDAGACRSALPIKIVTGETTQVAPPSSSFKDGHFNLRKRPALVSPPPCHPEAAESLAKPRTPNEGSLHHAGTATRPRPTCSADTPVRGCWVCSSGIRTLIPASMENGRLARPVWRGRPRPRALKWHGFSRATTPRFDSSPTRHHNRRQSWRDAGAPGLAPSETWESPPTHPSDQNRDLRNNRARPTLGPPSTMATSISASDRPHPFQKWIPCARRNPRYLHLLKTMRHPCSEPDSKRMIGP